MVKTVYLDFEAENRAHVVTHLLSLMGIARTQERHACDLVLSDSAKGVREEESGLILSETDFPRRLGQLADHIRRRIGQSPLSHLPEQIPVGENRDSLFMPKTLLFKNAAGAACALTEKERDLLSMLVVAGQDGLHKDALLKSVWAYAPDVETHTLETHIYRLRRKIEIDPGAPSILVNEDGVYKLRGV